MSLIEKKCVAIHLSKFSINEFHSAMIFLLENELCVIKMVDTTWLYRFERRHFTCSNNNMQICVFLRITIALRSIILCCSGHSSFPLVYFLELLLLNIIYWTYLKLYWVDKLVLLAYCCITLLNCLHNILFILQLSHSFTEKKLTFLYFLCRA